MKKTYKRIITLGPDKAPHFWTIGEDGAPKSISDLAAEIAADLNISSGKAIVTIEAEEREVAYVFSMLAYRDMLSSGIEWRLSDKCGRSVKIIDTEFENEGYPLVAKRRDANGTMQIYYYSADGLCSTLSEEDTLVIMVSQPGVSEQQESKDSNVTTARTPAPQEPAAQPQAPAQPETRPDPTPAQPQPETAPAQPEQQAPAQPSPQRPLGGFDQSRVTLKKIFQKLENSYPGEPMDKLLKEHSDMWANRFNYTIEQMMETFRNIKSVE